MACKNKVKVKDTSTGKEIEVAPEKMWLLAPRGRRGVKIGLFKSPDTGKYFRAKLPDDYAC